MTRKKITADGLLARAKMNGCQRSEHRDKDGLQDRNGYVNRIKPSQDLVRSHVSPQGGNMRDLPPSLDAHDQDLPGRCPTCKGITLPGSPSSQ